MNLRHFAKRLAVAAALAVAGCHVHGCASHGRGAVPAGAVELTSGDGHGVLRAVAPRAGTMYVLDRTDDRLVWSGEVRRDDEIAVEGDRGVIRQNGRTVSESRPRPNHRYELRFVRTGREE